MENIILYNVLKIDYEKLDNLDYVIGLSFKLPSNIIIKLTKDNEKRLLKNHTIKEINNLIDFLDEQREEFINLQAVIIMLVDFLINLIKIDELGLAKEVFDISNKYKFTGKIGIDEYSFSKYLVKHLLYQPENDVNTFDILLGFIGENDFMNNFSNILRTFTFSIRVDYIKELLNKLVISGKYDLLIRVINILAVQNYEGSGEIIRMLLLSIKKAIELKDYDLLAKYLKLIDLSIGKKLLKNRTRLLNIDDLMTLNKIS